MTGLVSLSESGRQILAELIKVGTATRPQLGRYAGLSRPTVSLAVAELEALGIASPLSTVHGALGRSPTLYGLGSGAGWVLGVDLGTTHSRAAAWALDGTVLDEDEFVPDSRRNSRASDLASGSARMIGRIRERVGGGDRPLRAVGFALGRRVAVRTDVDLTPVLGADIERLVAALELPAGTHLLFENNVNCSALGELYFGGGQGISNLAYVHLGVRIGAGIISNGSLLRGTHGGAGEVRYLPFPSGADERPSPGEFERWLGAASLLRRAREGWQEGAGRKPRTTRELFEAAQVHGVHVEHVINRYAVGVGSLIATLIAVVDPELVILGGGIGQNPSLVSPALRITRELVPYANLTVSELGDDASLAGATVLALEHARGALLGRWYSPSVTGTPLLVSV